MLAPTSPVQATRAFSTISEVAALLDLPVHVLRFWEARFEQIRPLRRTDGRRVYRPEDIALLNGIRFHLHALGYSIRGVQRILKAEGGIALVRNCVKAN